MRSAPSRVPPPPRFGYTEPRVFTPPLRELTEETSLGFSVIEFATSVCRVTLFPWQRWLLIHALELLPDNTLRFRNVVVLVARQNGKSMLSVVLSLWFMYVYGFPLVLGTAQDLDTAEEVWEKAVELVDDVDELRDLRERVVMVNGKKALELKTGQRYKVKAANRRAGRGLSGDLILLDELREHQTWDAWGAITKTTMARPMAQVWALSNAGDATSVVLRYLRKMAHAELGDPDGINADDDPTALITVDVEDVALDDESTLGIFEWSAAPGCDVRDRDAWAQGNPSLGYSITERTIGSAARTDPEWVFRTEVLCQWPAGAIEGPFPTGAWDSLLDDDSAPVGEKWPVCVDVSWDRSTAHIALVGPRADGRSHVEVVASRPGTDWVVPWLSDPARRGQWSAVAVQANGAPASSLVVPLTEAGLPVLEWSGSELGRATGAFYDAVRVGSLRRIGQPVLDVAASAARAKPMGDAWVWDRKNSPVDVAPLVAATGALWALGHEPAEPARSAYELRGVVSI